MSLRDLLRRLVGKQEEVNLAYSLDGNEKVSYGEIDQVMDRLQAVSAALSLFPIKNGTPEPPPAFKWMHELTDGMTPEQVREAFDGVIDLMNLLNKGSEGPYHATRALKISEAGALLTWSDTNIGFPFQGVTGPMPGGYTQHRIAESVGDALHLRLTVDGGKEVASISTWIVGRTTGQMSFSLKEARYWQVKDYGRVLLNQVIEAAGKVG